MARKGNYTAIQTRFDDPEFQDIENWRRKQAKIPPLADTVRQLVKLGMSASSAVDETKEQAG